MKRAGWAWSGNSQSAENLLRLTLWLIGLPYCLWVVALILYVQVDGEPWQVGAVQRMIEPLSGAIFDDAGFAALAYRRPGQAEPEWQDVRLPDSVVSPPLVDISPDAPKARLWLRFRYRQPASGSSGEQLAVYVTRIMAGPYTVWVDGRPVEANLDNWRIQWNVPLFVKLPPESQAPGHEPLLEISAVHGFPTAEIWA